MRCIKPHIHLQPNNLIIYNLTLDRLMQNESDYLVRNPKLILDYLSSLFTSHCILTAQFGQQKTSFLTAITEINAESGTLKIDSAPTEILNQQLINADKVIFHTQLNGIKAAFTATQIKALKTAENSFFEIPLPQALFWLERRNFYRVKIPLSHQYTYCTIPTAPQADNPSSTPILQNVFRLHDLSISGFAFLNADAALMPLFAEQQIHQNCTLHLPNSHSHISFTIKDISNIKVNTQQTELRIGCHFSPLPTIFESTLLRYMQDIERLIKNISL
jgi:flagellar brake protein